MSNLPLRTVLQQIHRLTGNGPADLTDAELLQRFLGQRDQAAFEVLVWRHGSLVLGVCRRLLHREPDAEDAFQATFLALVREGGRISKRDSVGSWLYKVAYRVARKVQVRLARRAARESMAMHEPAA